MSNDRPRRDDAEIEKYVTTGEGAVARCFVRDVLRLKAAGMGDWDIWWLDNVPCRKVLLVGILVGIMEYEKRVLYTIDDGTEVVDCLYQKVVVKAASDRLKSNLKNGAGGGATCTAALEELYVCESKYQVGDTVVVVGKVMEWRDTKRISVETIAECPVEEEPLHWLEVQRLHRTKYSRPFTVPAKIEPATPLRERTYNTIAQKSDPTAIASSAPTSPTCSSPVKAHTPPPFAESDPLRHPSRISSKQLNIHTFRIHLERYLDQASRPQASHPILLADDDPFYFDTPARRTRNRSVSPDRTPKAKSMAKRVNQRDNRPVGFSLSYLRRVPELDVLGRRIVRAEARKRAKEQKEQKGSSSSRQSTTLANRARPKLVPTKAGSERVSLKVKRLFQMTLRTLVEDGTIIVVDGPGRPWNVGTDKRMRGRCWRDAADTTIASIANASTSMNTTASSTRTMLTATMDEDPPSEPDDVHTEECYLPITPHVLAEPVLDVMRWLIGPGGGMRGVSVDSIVSRLRVVDEQWGQIHDEHVEDALRYLDVEQRAWRVGDSKWGLVEM